MMSPRVRAQSPEALVQSPEALVVETPEASTEAVATLEACNSRSLEASKASRRSFVVRYSAVFDFFHLRSDLGSLRRFFRCCWSLQLLCDVCHHVVGFRCHLRRFDVVFLDLWDADVAGVSLPLLICLLSSEFSLEEV